MILLCGYSPVVPQLTTTNVFNTNNFSVVFAIQINVSSKEYVKPDHWQPELNCKKSYIVFYDHTTEVKSRSNERKRGDDAAICREGSRDKAHYFVCLSTFSLDKEK